MGKRIKYILMQNLALDALQLGYMGENEHTQIVIDCEAVYTDYPSAVATMMVQLPNGDTYPKTVTKSGNNIVWTVEDSDLGISGRGRYQLTFTNSGEVIKSIIGYTQIDFSLDGAATPTPVQTWLQTAEAKLDEMEDATDAIEDMTVAATTLTPGSSATATITEVDGHKHIAFGIPQGEQGENVVIATVAETKTYLGIE